jgi:aryl-alcohol dehydrogenase-like predicted oxidoreductase
MYKMDRRKFIMTGVAGMVGSVVGVEAINHLMQLPADPFIDEVGLGNTGLKVSRMAMGTGSVGGGKASNQTRLGMEQFVKLAHHAYERGVRFYDMADSYGSQPFVGEAIKHIPRENITLLTKIWTLEPGQQRMETAEETLDRCRKEVGTDYFDIVLMHCMMRGGWTESRKYYTEALTQAKEKGIVKAVGLSCHSIEALSEAADSPWVDVIMARINPFQSKMDGTPEQITAILDRARANGKGVIGMKIFGEGTHVAEDERERSIRFALTEAKVHCMTLGLESIPQMDDAIRRVARLANV